MTLLDNWKDVLARAWSIRFMVLAIVASGMEVFLSIVDADFLGIPQGAFAALAAASTSVAMASRIIAQKDLSGGDK